MSYSRVLTLGGETFGELIALRMEMSPIVPRHDSSVSSQKGGCNESTANRRLFIGVDAEPWALFAMKLQVVQLGLRAMPTCRLC
jgi:hypothetical protein